MPLLKGLESSDLVKLATVMQQCFFKAGDHIIKQVQYDKGPVAEWCTVPFALCACLGIKIACTAGAQKEAWANHKRHLL